VSTSGQLDWDTLQVAADELEAAFSRMGDLLDEC
jgi:hypothetical protein